MYKLPCFVDEDGYVCDADGNVLCFPIQFDGDGADCFPKEFYDNLPQMIVDALNQRHTTSRL